MWSFPADFFEQIRPCLSPPSEQAADGHSLPPRHNTKCKMVLDPLYLVVGLLKLYSIWNGVRVREIPSEWSVSREGYAVHQATKPMIVVDRVMHRRAVIPERHCTRTPTEPAGEFRLNLVLEKEIQNGRAFLLGHAVEADRVGSIDV
jgi:hypothetical protein